MLFLLLHSGDVETNPGPNTRSESALENLSFLSEPSEQMAAIFNLLKDVHACSVQSAKNQAKLAADIKAIKASQKSIENKIGRIQERLDTLEEKTDVLDQFAVKPTYVQNSLQAPSTQHDSLQTRLYELEDRSRCNNLLFRDIPDSRKSWKETEDSVKDTLTGIDNLPDLSIECTHRLCQYSPSKCRPIIVKFNNFKLKECVLSTRSKLKDKCITVSEDFSPATRIARIKLVEFTKNLPGSPSFQLRYNKITVNEKLYTNNASTDSIVGITMPPKTDAFHGGAPKHNTAITDSTVESVSRISPENTRTERMD
ncbi:uncharacterized protein LOC144130931 [Amblyomma americanum]